MSGLFRGALSLIQGESSSSSSHPLIGSQVEVGSIRLRIDSLIAEGGFAVVFAAYDSANRWYALKRQLTKDRESMEAVLLEIQILKKLTGHPAILEFIAAAQMKIPSGGVEFMLLTELCSGGSVADLMKHVRLTPEQALKIFHAAASAARHMHDRTVPIIHRDIKIENLLFDSRGNVKLCDFGSATTEVYRPDETWNMSKRSQLEEEMQRHTTPMYRAPEILDTYQNFVVGPQQDIWALGCVLFYLCYHVHPFEDSAKLRILNVVYSVPAGFDEFADIFPVVESCLKVDPLDRPSAKDLVERAEALAIAFDIDFKKPVSNIDTGLLRRSQAPRPAGGVSSDTAPPPSRSSVKPEEITEQASAMFGALKSQGLSLLKNIKDRSSAVVQKVQAKLVSQEVTWITSRMCIVPATNVNLEHCDEEEWSSRVAASGRPFVIYNLTSIPLRANYSIEPITYVLRSVNPNVPPALESILKICSSVVTFLRNRPGSAVVFFGLEAHCMLVCAAMLVYSKLIGDANDAFDFVANKRGTAQRFSPSQIHTLDLIKNLTSSASVVLLPMSRPMILHSISFSTLPILAGIRGGLRPLIEVYVGASKVWDSAGSQSAFVVSKSLSTELDVKNLRLDGQITIVMSYCRSDPANVSSKKVLFCLVFHTSVAGELMKFSRADIDINPTEENNVPNDFSSPLALSILKHMSSLSSLPYISLSLSDECAELVKGALRAPSLLIVVHTTPLLILQKRHLRSLTVVSATLARPFVEQSCWVVFSQCMLAGRHHGYQALGRKPQLFQRIALGLRFCNQDDSLSSDLSSQDTNVLRAGSPDLLVLDLDEQRQIMDWYSVSTERSASVDGPRSEVSDRSTAPSDVTTDFFQTLDWSQTQHSAQHSASPIPPPVPAHRSSPVPPVPPARGVRQAPDPFTAVTTSTSSSRSVSNPRGMETSETYDGIRIQHSQQDPDADKYRFDCDKETPILNASSPCGVTSEFDLLGLGESSAPPLAPPTTAPGELAKPVLDPFFDLINDNWSAPLESAGTGAATAPTAAAAPPHAAHTTDALLGEWSGTSNLLNVGNPSSIHRNVSAPVFQPSSSNFDPFAEFLSQSASNPASAQESASNSGSTTPMPSRPNYSRTAFENINSGTTAPKAKVTGDAFGDLLSSHGFTASSKNANRTLGDLRRAEEVKDMDPVAIKIRDWTGGKERNIRALLGSLNDVLWEGAEKWQQPRMADLLSAAQVKRSYYKACLVVHPDKQVGEPHEKLARAIFTELNDAWNAFEQSGFKSL